MFSGVSMGARICCVDLDCFFVSVERLLDPTLVGKQVVVGASPGKRGVVTAASYEVRALGVKSGMPISEAVRLAPHAVYLPSRHGVYAPYAKQVRAVLERFTPDVQTASIDEFFLDFRGTERLWRRPGDAGADATVVRVVREMRERIFAEVGLPASAGLGSCRPIAKIASNRAKPAGVFVVPEGSERDFLGPMGVRAFPGIGPSAEARLHAANVWTLGELMASDPSSRLVQMVLRAARGGNGEGLGPDRPAFFEHDPEGSQLGSISNERTFHADVGAHDRVLAQLRALAERVCWRARRRGVRARTVTLKLRTADFRTVQRGHTAKATHEETEVFQRVCGLLERAWSRRQPVRLVGVQLSNLVVDGPQLGLPLGDRPRMGAALDAVRERFGYDAIRLGAVGASRWQGEAS
jgi:DNA polymerase IV